MHWMPVTVELAFAVTPKTFQTNKDEENSKFTGTKCYKHSVRMAHCCFFVKLNSCRRGSNWMWRRKMTKLLRKTTWNRPPFGCRSHFEKCGSKRHSQIALFRFLISIQIIKIELNLRLEVRGWMHTDAFWHSTVSCFDQCSAKKAWWKHKMFVFLLKIAKIILNLGSN